MKKYNCVFQSEGTELFCENGFVCEKISFNRYGEPAMWEDKIVYAGAMMISLINKKGLFVNREILQQLKDIGIEKSEIKTMLECFMMGKSYRNLARATGVRIGLYEIQFGIQMERPSDEDHYAFSYLVIPLVNTTGFMVVRDQKRKGESVKISWEKGMIKEVSV